MNKKRLIILISAAAAVLIAAITITCTLVGNKTCKIGMYGLSEEVTQAISEEITKSYPDNTKIEILDSTKPLAPRDAKKYNLIFTMKGATTTAIAEKLKPFPEEVYNLMPSNIGAAGKINGENLVLPVLLDHWEIAYYRTYREQCKLGIPQIDDHLKLYLEMIKDKAIFPLYLAGADDETLLGFISLVAESMMTKEAYNQLLTDMYMTAEYDKPLPESLMPVMEKIQEMVENQYIYRKWYENTTADLDFAMKEHKVGSIVTSLSNHRKMPFVIIKYYDSFMYPKASPDSTGIVAPMICAVMPKDKGNASQIAQSLVHTDQQTSLSDATKLAPVNSRAQSHDMQADDVRFMAASTSGPEPSIIEGSCSSPAAVKKLAEQIRAYLQK